MKHVIRRLTMLLLAMSSGLSLAQMPTPDQIQQFKSMSTEQKRQMAEAAGIDINSVMGGQGNAQPQLGENNQGVAERERAVNMPESGYANTSEKDGSDKNEKTEEEKDKDKLYFEPEDGGTYPLPLFGKDLFRNSGAFRPVIDIPVPADYVMGPGDNIIVQLYGKENFSHALTINREGQIQFPQIGPVNLAGLTFSQAQKVIEDIVDKQMIGIKSSITMGALRTIRVFVLGEVVKPGSFTVGSLSTLTNALFASGGVTDVGSMRNIQLKRQGKTITQFDVYDLLLKGDTSKDVRLLPGDVIFVPPIGSVATVQGAVKRPATYELRQSSSIMDLIDVAGGLRNTAHLPVSYLVRLDDIGEKTLINLDLTTPQGRNKSIQTGDVLAVSSALDFVNNQVMLSGHIKRAGPRSWRQGLRFTDLVKTPLELLPNPDIDIALIERASNETRLVEVVLFSPQKAWMAPGTAADPLILPYDVIQIFNFEDDRAEQLEPVVKQMKAQSNIDKRERIVSISGSVRFPGTYPLSEVMNTKELIELAGGLLESAMGTQGEITRYEVNENRQRVVSHQQLNFLEDAVLLSPGDTLQVKQIPLWKDKESIEITGEVMFPGTYSILPGETLSDVLVRAGGLTPHAYPVGAVFSRMELRELEQQRLQELKGKIQGELAASNVSEAEEEVDEEQAQALLENIDTIKPLGRMVINLPLILSDPGRHDFQLENGDAIHVPRYKPSVTVVGEVQYPTSHFYNESLDAMAYIERSGGMKKHADDNRVYIVKANGSVIQPDSSAWFKVEAASIHPGDTIVVPLETDRVDKLTIWSKATQIMYQAALGAAAINGL